MPSIERWFIFCKEHLLLTRECSEPLTEHDAKQFEHAYIRQYSFDANTHANIVCAEIPENIDIPAHFELFTLRHAIENLTNDWFNIAAKAAAIINWDKNHQFCGRCGIETTHKINTFERKCDSCQLTFYPRISPSIIVLIHDQDKILMARGHHFKSGVFGLIAGFVEPGESIEDAVHRETWEEVRLKIKNLTYFGSQSWPFPDSLMIAFTAEYAEGDIIIDPVEIAEAGWYRYDSLPGRHSSNISIATKLLNHFLEKQKV